MTQVVTRIPADLLSEIDALVDDETVASRSDAVRRGLEMLIDRERRRRVVASIVGGYTALPQTEEEVGWADEATRRMIGQEPW
ncbi:MAG: hypothetical protein FJW79_11260 [Actinobacteria bacterium]|nr:hypothetical protein [Actinomycetota bacterium]